ncbi:MAG: hypothetical protein GY868_03250 [Deltaproteobacteria bacterium]|nr:hypothetical protein [Deltaproteobacteria bacterium]
MTPDMQIDTVVIKTFITLTIYCLLLGTLILSSVRNSEHDDVNMNGSLICYSCIGI